MSRIGIAVLTLFLTSVTLFAPGSAQAQTTGELSAVAYQEVPATEAFEVRALDNADDNLELVERMQQELRLRGRGVADGARLVMTLERRDDVGAWATTNRRHVLEVTGDSGPGTDDETEVKVNLFDSQSGGVLNEGESGTTIVTPSQTALLVRIEDRTNGRQLWEGWAAADITQGNNQRLLLGMIPIVADSVGKTVSKQAVPLN